MATFVASVSPVRAHHGDIHPSKSAECSRCPTARADTAPDRIFAADIDHRMAGQKLHEMLRHANRAHARAAAAVRNAKCLVQIQMAHVRADVARAAKPDLRVHVRAVHDKPARRCAWMISQISRIVSSNTPCVDGYVTISAARSLACASALALQIGHVDVAVRRRIATDHDLHPRHDRAGGIGAVRGLRNETDIAMRLAARFMICADHQQARRIRPANRRSAASEMPANPVISASHSSSC